MMNNIRNPKFLLDVLPPSVKIIYNVLQGNYYKIKDIKKKTTYSERSIRDALKVLVELQLINKEYDSNDLRSYYFYSN